MFTFLTEVFCLIDDFCKAFLDQKQNFLPTSVKRNRKSRMTLSEIMTILVLFHRSDYKTFKHFYLQSILIDYKKEFPRAVKYSRFIQMMPCAMIPLLVFFQGIKGQETGTYFVDSTPIKVCHIKREKQHRVFKGFATKSKSTMGWFFGYKVHLVINNKGEIMSLKITGAKTDDRNPVAELVKKLKGWLFGDKGYISQTLTERLKKQGIELITKVKKNMKKKILQPAQKWFLNKRGIVESVIDQLKNICQIEHTRHRSPINALVNLISGFVAYQLKPRKPSICKALGVNMFVA